MIPRSQGKYLVWDVTCPDPFCISNCPRAISEPGGAAAHAEIEKSRKYAHLDSMYLFQPVAIETSGATGPETGNFPRELGKRIKTASREQRSFGFLLQRISVAIQIGNSTSVLGTLPVTDSNNFCPLD